MLQILIIYVVYTVYTLINAPPLPIAFALSHCTVVPAGTQISFHTTSYRIYMMVTKVCSQGLLEDATNNYIPYVFATLDTVTVLLESL